MQLKTTKDRNKSQIVSKTEASAKPFKSGLVMIHTIKFTPCGFPAEIKLDEPRTFLPIEAFVAWLLGRTFEKVILTIITVIINITITILIILHTWLFDCLQEQRSAHPDCIFHPLLVSSYFQFMWLDKTIFSHHYVHPVFSSYFIVSHNCQHKSPILIISLRSLKCFKLNEPLID